MVAPQLPQPLMPPPPMPPMPMGGGMPGGPMPGGMPPMPMGAPGMGGPMPGGMPGITGPMAAGGGGMMPMVPMLPQAQDPQMMILQMLMENPELLEQIFPQPIEKYREPWQKPEKPTVSKMITKIQGDRSIMLALNRRFDMNIGQISMETSGTFRGFDPDEDVPWKNPALADEDQLIGSIVGSIPPTFQSPKMRPADEDESQAKEDFLHYLHDEHRRQHTRAGFGDLGIEIVKTSSRYGRLICRNIPSLSKRPGACPFTMKMIDPATACPTFSGDRGLTTMTLVYYQTVASFIGDNDTDGSIEDQLKSASGDFPFQLMDSVECYEYWDPRWMALFCGGKLVKMVEHGLGEPPFTYVQSTNGDPSYTRSPEGSRMIRQGQYMISSVEADWVRRGLSHFSTRFVPHAQLEALESKAATMAAKWGKEPLILAQDDSVYNKTEPIVSRTRDSLVKIRKEHEELMPFPENPMPPAVSALVDSARQAGAKAGLSPEQFGLTPSAQQSGYAIAGLSERGQQKLTPVRTHVELFHKMNGEQRLRFFRENGDQMGAEGQRGSIQFPMSYPGSGPNDEQMWTLTPHMIDRTGCQVECKLIEVPDMGTLAQMANTFGILGEQGVMSRVNKIKMAGLPGSRNPRQAAKEIDVEKLREMPEFRMGELLKYVMDDLKEPGFANFISAQVAKTQMMGASQMMPQGPAGGPPANVSGPQGMQGQSMAAAGPGTGTQGGAPSGGPQPPPPAPNRPMGPGLER